MVMSHLVPLILLTACEAPATPQGDGQAAAITAQAPVEAIPAVQVSPTPTATPVNPTGHFLYVGNYADTVITVYEIQSDGSLTFVQDAGVPGGVTYLSLDHTQQTLYAGIAYSVGGSVQRIFQYSIDSSTGELTNTTPGFSQSIFVAQGNGGSFTSVATSAIYMSFTYTISGGRIDSPNDNYVAGNNPVTLLMR